jgi:hypothetical protein
MAKKGNAHTAASNIEPIAGAADEETLALQNKYNTHSRMNIKKAIQPSPSLSDNKAGKL